VLFLLAGGASAYYFRNDLVKLPIIKNIFLNKNVAINEVSVPVDQTKARTKFNQFKLQKQKKYNQQVVVR